MGRNDVPYLDRFQFLHITVHPAAAFPNIQTVLLDTRFCRNEGGRTSSATPSHSTQLIRSWGCGWIRKASG